MILLVALFLWMTRITPSQAWILSSSTPPCYYNRHVAASRLSLSFDDFEDFSQDEQDDSSSDLLLASLRARQRSLDAQRRQQLQAWRQPPTNKTTMVPLAKDWVRRLAVDLYPHVMVGGASGSLYYMNAETGVVHDYLPNLHLASRKDKDDNDQYMSYLMYGEYDGGGLIAMATKDNLVASAGRDGGVKISCIELANQQLEFLGGIPNLDHVLVTSLAFDRDGILWVGSFGDKMIRGYDLLDIDDDDGEADRIIECYYNLASLVYQIQADSQVLSLSIADEIGCGVAATAQDGILLFSLEDGAILGRWNPFPQQKKDETLLGRLKNPFVSKEKRKEEFARSVLLVQNDEDPRAPPPMSVPDPKQDNPISSSKQQSQLESQYTVFASPIWSVVVGGSLGSIHQRKLSITAQGIIDRKKPFDNLAPSHQVDDQLQHSGPIVCLTSPGPNLLISGAQDGTLRFWDCSYMQQPKKKALQQSSSLDRQQQQDESIPTIRKDEMGNTKPTIMYALAGFKVWLGSIVALNDNILVSDGADNCIVVQRFGEKSNGHDDDQDDDYEDEDE